MNRFDYTRPSTIADAVKALSGDNSRALAGGTNLVDLMKYDVARPALIVDINHLPLRDIAMKPDGSVVIGALVSNSDAAWHDGVRVRFPLLASAILAGASPQLRNAATMGGNLLQRTRCMYFYDPAMACGKRDPGTTCSAIGGATRNHAILGASDACIATHPSDMCVALAALDATVHVEGVHGARTIPFSDFHRLPGDTPEADNTLRQGDIITAIELPPSDFGKHYTYLKIRDRLSYAFALVSVAAALKIEGNEISEARVALGGVAHKPWRDREAEKLLIGNVPSAPLFSAFAQRLLSPARGQGENDFKSPLAQRAIVRALTQAANGTPQSQSDKSIA